jgi:sensor histidine kinase regulating citrate/malate metabolism
MDHILSTISDGYIIVNNCNRITRINQSAKTILKITDDNNVPEPLLHFLKESDKSGYGRSLSLYDEL